MSHFSVVLTYNGILKVPAREIAHAEAIRRKYYELKTDSYIAMKLYWLNELMDRDIGPAGTPRRDKFERKPADEFHACHIGEAVKKARLAMTLTQEKLGQGMGVQRSQACRIESGKGIAIASMMRGV